MMALETRQSAITSVNPCLLEQQFDSFDSHVEIVDPAQSEQHLILP